jgi:hypothetical protein
MIDFQRFFDLGMKATSFIQEAAQAGSDVSIGVKALTNIFSKKPDQVTTKDLDDAEKMLDDQIAKFNEELPEEA